MAHAFRIRILTPLLFLPLSLLAANEDLRSSSFASTASQPGPLFVKIAPEVSGLRNVNNYDDPEMWGRRYQEFLFGSIGTGLAVGDFDNDGLPDLFVVGKTDSCRLYRNRGNFKFDDVTEAAGVADSGSAAKIWKQGCAFVDINNDGWLDLYVCRFNAPNLLYINQGNGTFKESAHSYGLDIVDACGMASFADYDRDGWLDVYLANNLLDGAKHPVGQKGRLLHNDGHGHFVDVSDQAGIYGEAQTHSATWWDYDGDGWPDLYVANDYGLPDRLYHNERNGTFTNTLDNVFPHTSSASMGSDFGDVNNDGLMDFLVADMAPTTHEKVQRSAADTRAKTRDPLPGSTQAPKYNRNALLINTGLGQFQEAALLAGVGTTDWTWSVRFEDLDNDGYNDLFVTNGMNVEQNSDLLARQMAAETPEERIRIMRSGPTLPETHLVFQNTGHLQFKEVGKLWGLDEKGISFGAAFGDFDGDGRLDVVYVNYKGSVSLFRNQGAGTNSLEIALVGTRSNRFGIGSAVRVETNTGLHASQLYPARGYMSTSQPVLHFGLGQEKTAESVEITWPSGTIQRIGPLEAGRLYTVTEPVNGQGATAKPSPPPTLFTPVKVVGLQETNVEGALDELATQHLQPFRYNNRGPSLAVTRTSTDQADVLAVGGTGTTPLRLVSLDGTSVAAPAVPYEQGVDDGPVLFFDANGDGEDDLLVSKGGNALTGGSPEYQPHLFLGKGHHLFEPAPSGALPDMPQSTGALAAADFDGDGLLDVFVGARLTPGEFPTVPTSTLLRNKGGRFEDVTDTTAPGLAQVGLVTAALWTDLNSDGKPDLLVACDWGQVHAFVNDGRGHLSDQTATLGFDQAGTGWWTSLASADFNSDGIPDYVLGNMGLNTPYRADAAHPAVLFSGDFANSGTVQLVQGYYENGRLLPFRSRRELGNDIPSLLKRFPKNNDFAKATLEDLLGKKALDAADVLKVTELRSGVLLSHRNAAWTFEPFPPEAQIAPLQGVVCNDFDGDGFADVLAVQNLYSPVPYVGRFDGGVGLLLRGTGTGRLLPVPPAESGFLVTGDAKALVVAFDAKQEPHVIASRNQDKPVVFALREPSPQLVVILEGKAPNRRAIGARLSVSYADGHSDTREITAGSGLYSQTSTLQLFGIPDKTAAVRVRVRWPDGELTEQPLTPGVRVLTLKR